MAKMLENSLEDDISDEFFTRSTLRMEDKEKRNGNLSLGIHNTTEISLDDRTPDLSDLPEAAESDKKWTASTVIPNLKETVTGIWTKAATSRAVMEPSVLPLTRENASNFFTFRDGIVKRAVDDCVAEFINAENDGELLEAFLLTEITHWDSDKERLILIAEKCVYTIKYDFIALKQLDFKRINLLMLDGIVVGDLVYPNGSLVPDRNMKGVRLLWNKGLPVGFVTKWNPFKNDMPMLTFTSHPLFYHKDCETDVQRRVYDIDAFHLKLGEVIGNLERSKPNRETICIIRHEDIVLQSYVGLTSLIHNRNALGFFKVRGKFSF